MYRLPLDRCTAYRCTAVPMYRLPLYRLPLYRCNAVPPTALPVYRRTNVPPTAVIQCCSSLSVMALCTEHFSTVSVRLSACYGTAVGTFVGTRVL